MSIFTGIIVYMLIWWTALFAVLPIGVRPDAEGDAASGGWRGAPERPLLLRKIVGTTVLSAALWLVVYALVEAEWTSLRTGWLALPER